MRHDNQGVYSKYKEDKCRERPKHIATKRRYNVRKRKRNNQILHFTEEVTVLPSQTFEQSTD